MSDWQDDTELRIRYRTFLTRRNAFGLLTEEDYDTIAETLGTLDRAWDFLCHFKVKLGTGVHQALRRDVWEHQLKQFPEGLDGELVYTALRVIRNRSVAYQAKGITFDEMINAAEQYDGIYSSAYGIPPLEPVIEGIARGKFEASEGITVRPHRHIPEEERYVVYLEKKVAKPVQKNSIVSQLKLLESLIQ